MLAVSVNQSTFADCRNVCQQVALSRFKYIFGWTQSVYFVSFTPTSFVRRSVLLRLVYHCGLELDPKRGNRRTSSTRRRSTRLSSTTSVNPSGTESTAASKLTEASLSEEAIFSPGDGPKIYLSVLNNLSYQTRSLNVCGEFFAWTALSEPRWLGRKKLLSVDLLSSFNSGSKLIMAVG